MTKQTCLKLFTSRSTLPFTATGSAFAPGLIEPIRWSIPHRLAIDEEIIFPFPRLIPAKAHRLTRFRMQTVAVMPLCVDISLVNAAGTSWMPVDVAYGTGVAFMGGGYPVYSF